MKQRIAELEKELAASGVTAADAATALKGAEENLEPHPAPAPILHTAVMPQEAAPAPAPAPPGGKTRHPSQTPTGLGSMAIRATRTWPATRSFLRRRSGPTSPRPRTQPFRRHQERIQRTLPHRMKSRWSNWAWVATFTSTMHARFMTQFGTYSTQRCAMTAAYAKANGILPMPTGISRKPTADITSTLYGLNVDAGIFMSYIGLFSYYNFDNWAYQPSYVSSNTPWFFQGVRIQIFPTAHLKIEPWIINGWQSYARQTAAKASVARLSGLLIRG